MKMLRAIAVAPILLVAGAFAAHAQCVITVADDNGFPEAAQYTFDANAGASDTISAGSSVNVTVTQTTPGEGFCGSWVATPSQSWITIQGSNTGTGNGSIVYGVGQNTSVPRSATITFSLPDANPAAQPVVYTVYQTGADVAIPGPYRIDYQYNSAGCATDGQNPFNSQCVAIAGSGPYVISNLNPGIYTITTNNFVSPAEESGAIPFQADAWVGLPSAPTGTFYQLSSTSNGTTTVVVNSGQDLVLYSLNGSGQSDTTDNDPNGFADVSVAFTSDLLTVSCVPTAGPTQVGVAYSATCTASGGTSPYTWNISSGSLPPGINLSSSTGSSITVSGTPATQGQYAYTVQVTDNTPGPAPLTAQQSYSGTIGPAPPPPLTIQCSTAAGPTQAGAPYSATCTASGGTGPYYTWSISSGALPTGLSLTTSGLSATVSGTPTTAEQYSYTLQVVDSGSPAQTQTQVYSGTIAAESCSVSISYTSGSITETTENTFDAAAGTNGINATGTVNVSVTEAPSGACGPWSAKQGANWVSIASPGSGTGNGSISYTVAANTGVPRGTQITFNWPNAAGGAQSATYTVNQTGAATVPLPGPYRIDYEDNAAGCSATSENPFSCGTTSGSGAYVLNPGPGVYTITVNAFNAPGQLSETAAFQPLVWVGNANTGKATALPTTANQTAAVIVGAGQQLVLYTLNGSSSTNTTGNDPNGFADVTVSQSASALTMSCVPTTGPTQVGVAYSATCTASGGTSPYTWAISAGTLPAGLSLSATTGSSITVSGTPTTAGPYSYTVQAKDSTPAVAQTATQSYSGTIASAPPPPLSISCNTTAGPNQAGAPYSATCTASGGTSPYTWSISAGKLPAGLNLTSSDTSATISGTPTTAGQYSYTVQVADSGSPAQTQTQVYSGTIAAASCSVSVSYTNPSITETTENTFDAAAGTNGINAAGTINVSVTETPAGACGPWTAISGATWVALGSPSNGSGNGSVGYTVAANTGVPRSTQITFNWPNAAGGAQNATYTVNQTGPASVPLPGPYRIDYEDNAAGCSTSSENPFNCGTTSGSGAYVLSPSPGVYTITVNAFHVPGQQGDTSFQPLVWVGTANSGTATALPTTANQTATVTVEQGQQLVLYALNATGLTDTSSNDPNGFADVTVSQTGSLLSVSCVPSTGPTQVGLAYSTTCTASGGTSPYNWSISAGSLPAGLSLSATTGSSVTVSGTPTNSGNYSYTVQVTDSTPGPAPESATQDFSGTIASAVPALTLGCSPNTGPAQVGVAYTANCTASGGSGTYNWSISVGTLPPGIGLSASTGNPIAVSGTPSTAGEYSYTVQVTDTSSPTPQTATQSYSGTVAAPALKMSCVPTTGPVQVGVAYSATCTPSGGTAPYNWAISTGTLPGGLNLTVANSGGTSATISGTPTTAGPYAYTVQATDNSSPAQSQTQAYSGTIASAQPPPLTMSCVPATGPSQAGAVYSTTCTLSGGTAPYNWSISAGTLPTGLSLTPSANGTTATVAGTPTTAGQYSYTVQVTDTSEQTASQSFSGTLSAESCSVSVSYTSASISETTENTFDAAAGTNNINAAGTVNVSVSETPAGACGQWNATSGANWVIIANPSSGTGNGSINYTVAANTSVPRSTPITFNWPNAAGGAKIATYTVNQTGTASVPLPGPYRIDYEDNAAGCSTSSENPFNCGTTSGSGAYVLSPGPGVYKITINAFNAPGQQNTTPFQPLIWVGTQASGTATPLPTTANQTATVTVGAGQQLVLYGLNGTDSTDTTGNDPNGFADVTVTQSGSLLTMSCTPSTGPTQVGLVYSTTCTASGGISPYSWAISAGALPTGLTLSGTTGSSITISGTPLSAGGYGYTVQVTDNPSEAQTATQAFSGTIASAPPPALGISCSTAAGPTQAGTPYTASCTASGGTSPYTWSISSGNLPTGLSLTPGPNGTTATIAGTPATAGQYAYTVQVVDSSSPVQTQRQAYSGTIGAESCSVSVSFTDSSITEATENTFDAAAGTSGFNAAGTVNVSVTETPTGACGPWNAASGASWVALGSPSSGNGNGSVSYTVATNTGAPRSTQLTFTWPKAAGGQQSATYTINQTGAATVPTPGPYRIDYQDNAAGCSTASENPFNCGTTSGSGAYVLSPTPGTYTITVNTFKAPNQENTTPFEALVWVGTASGGTVTTLPATANQTATVTIQQGQQLVLYALNASDSTNTTANDPNGFADVTVAQSSALLSVSCVPTTGPTQVGLAYSATCTASGGTSPYKWSISAGTLPAGIAPSGISGSSITISGMPTAAGQYAYTVQVSDSSSPVETQTQAYSGTIAPAAPNLTIGCSPVTGPTQVGVSYLALCTASGGSGTYNWSISSGTLPGGIGLSATTGNAIAVTGTPTTTSQYAYTVQVSDTTSPTPETATQSYSGTIAPPAPTISCVPVTGPVQVGVAYSSTCTGSGGVAPYTWKISAGTLPDGLNLTASSNGATATVSGTPATAGQYSYTVQLTDSTVEVPQTATQTFSGTIATAALAISCSPTTGPALVGAAYSATCTASGGTSPYTWSVSAGALPAGLSLTQADNTVSATVSGTPTTAGQYAYTVQVADSSSPAQTQAQAYSGTVASESCSVSVSFTAGSITEKTENTFDASAGTNNMNAAGIVNVSVTEAPAGACGQWNAASGASWVTIANPSSGTGNGSVSYTVAANTGAPRTTQLTFSWPNAAGGPQSATYTINQTGPASVPLPGPYRIDYQYNAAGCSPSAENPFNCGTASGSGAYALSPGPGVYTITVNAFNAPGQQSDTAAFQPLVWVGDANTGTATALPTTANQTATVTVGANQKVVLYALNGSSSTDTSGNDPNGFADVTVALSSSLISMSCTPTTGPTQVSLAYSTTCTASGGTAPYTWAINSGTLPPGIGLSATSGSSVKISGMPTAAAKGSYSYSIQVTDSTPVTPQTAAQSFSGTIAAALPTLTMACSPNSGPSTAGVAYAAACTASGGSGNYNWSISAGALPTGISLSATTGNAIAVSGTPTGSGAYAYTVEVTDTTARTPETATQSFSGTIAAPSGFSLTSVSPTSATAGGSAFTLTANGSGFISGAAVNWNGSVLATSFVNSGQLTASVPASLIATSGTAQVTVTEFGTASAALPFSIAAPAFTIKSLNPSSATAGGAAFTMIVAGSGFVSSSVVNWNGSALPTSFVNSGQLNAQVAASLIANPGVAQITVSAAGATSNALSLPLTAAITLTGLTATSVPTQAVSIGIQLASPAQNDITGTLQLSFTPSVSGLPSGYMDPALQFSCANATCASGNTVLGFTVPKGQTSIQPLPGATIQQGTVAGTITVTVTSLTSGGVNVLPTSGISGTITVPALAPVINSVQFANVTSTGFDIQVTGYSTSRDMSSVTFTFGATNGDKLLGTTTFSVLVSTPFSQWFDSTPGQESGSTFLLTVPFSLSGDITAIQGVSATLTNSVGTSGSVSGTRQ